MEHLTPQQVAEWVAAGTDPVRGIPVLVDVREDWEFETARIAGATLVPMSSLATRIGELEDLQAAEGDTPRSLVCICHHGARSMQVAAFLEKQGFTHLVNMTGGIHAWSQQVDPAVPTY